RTLQPSPYPISVKQLNAAIESIQPTTPLEPAKPRLVKRPAKSPHELIMGTPLGAKKPEAPANNVGQSDVPEDVWDPVLPMNLEEEERLDAVSFPQNDDIAGELTKSQTKQEVTTFLANTIGTLDTLRGSLKTLREETEKLEKRREATRQKISVRIDALKKKLEEARNEA
ncbi:MAG: hypothetical protein AAF986_05670, partial [Pseudomonadota bacterium]